jgi:hypothetical protein
MIGLIGILLLSLCTSNKLWNEKDFAGWEMFTADETVDAKSIWSIQDGVMHCKGIPTGYIRTTEDYDNYILTLEWRWVKEPGNSGVLLHAQLPDQVWPNCVECQLKTGNAGDFVLIGPGSITVNNEKHTNTERFHIIAKRQESNEASPGEWNHYKIVCKENTITCWVNDVLQNEGSETTLSSGKICLQSEGAPIEFRNIVLKPL